MDKPQEGDVWLYYGEPKPLTTEIKKGKFYHVYTYAREIQVPEPISEQLAEEIAEELYFQVKGQCATQENFKKILLRRIAQPLPIYKDMLAIAEKEIQFLKSQLAVSEKRVDDLHTLLSKSEYELASKSLGQEVYILLKGEIIWNSGKQ